MIVTILRDSFGYFMAWRGGNRCYLPPKWSRAAALEELRQRGESVVGVRFVFGA